METQILAPVPMVNRSNQGTHTISRQRAPAALPQVSQPSLDAGRAQQSATDAEARRIAALRRAMENANLFVISDHRFTIYKDISGQYITRFTSLRDGRVTYIPEPDILSWMNQGGGEPEIKLDA